MCETHSLVHLQVRPYRMMEPYVLVRRESSPLYNETLLHRFYNKIAYVNILVHEK